MNPEEDITADYVDRRAPRGGTITERVQTLDDLLYEANISFRDLVPFPVPINKNQRAQNANAIIMTITEIYNEGTILNWDDNSQYKYYLYFEKVQGEWQLDAVHDLHNCALLGAGHYFKSRELAQDAYNKFKYVWDDLLPE